MGSMSPTIIPAIILTTTFTNGAFSSNLFSIPFDLTLQKYTFLVRMPKFRATKFSSGATKFSSGAFKFFYRAFKFSYGAPVFREYPHI